MTFRLVYNSRVFITTESPTSAIDLDGTVACVADSSLDATDGISNGKAIRKLGDVTAATNTNSLIPNVIGVDYPDSGEVRETQEIINGFKSPTQIKIRKDVTVSLVIIRSNGVWDRLFDKAPFGVNATDDGLFDGLSIEANNPNIGYRLYVYDGVTFSVFRHCKILAGGYTKDVSDRDGSVSETITFSTNDFDLVCPSGEISTEAPLI